MVATNSKIQWVGSPNYWHGRANHVPLAICEHGTGSKGAFDGENYTGVINWFKNPASEVSAHFLVTRAKGLIFQFVSLGDSAWANGIVTRINPAIPWLVDYVNRNINPNLVTISIEHENDVNNSLGLTDLQYKSTLWLHKYILGVYSDIPLDATGIVLHKDIDGVNRSRCPGANFPIDQLRADLQAWRSSSQSAPAPEFNPNPLNKNIGAGMLEYARANKLTLKTDEMYFDPEDSAAPEKVSFCYIGDGTFLLAYIDKQTGAADIRRVKDITGG